MTKGQRALAGVLALDGQGLTISRDDAATAIGVSHGMVGWARTVAEYAPSLVERVLRPEEPGQVFRIEHLPR